MQPTPFLFAMFYFLAWNLGLLKSYEELLVLVYLVEVIFTTVAVDRARTRNLFYLLCYTLWLRTSAIENWLFIYILFGKYFMVPLSVRAVLFHNK